MAEVQVRPARREDASTLVEFQLRLAEESEGMTLDRPTVGRGVRAVFDDPTKGRYWVAEADGRAVGCLLAVPEWSDWRCATVLWIHSLYVLPEARRQGVFKALYGHLKRQVEESPDLTGLRLYVDKANQAAQQVYQALGMTREHYHLYEWMKGM
jgi:GNAT superfamily N-acetyltransferase